MDLGVLFPKRIPRRRNSPGLTSPRSPLTETERMVTTAETGFCWARRLGRPHGPPADLNPEGEARIPMQMTSTK